MFVLHQRKLETKLAEQGDNILAMGLLDEMLSDESGSEDPDDDELMHSKPKNKRGTPGRKKKSPAAPRAKRKPRAPKLSFEGLDKETVAQALAAGIDISENQVDE